ncbi:hypothetical protein RBG61_05010 [Paludicola sp. MB14-C6]|uniref:hypothetical protein n=1 Tax=Paludihabitans sp. MB14-C6 TaxID=3070656 RepID=UPI0027DCCFD1|nr:hypothetical protein [Paludicola sp. MB14-C6]WMJ24032.1 hypothetical protein RBG61_05010 [Paludicola sp. MB14-C6]
MNNQNPLDEENRPIESPAPQPSPKEKKHISALATVGIVLLVLFAIPILLFGACILIMNLSF